MTGAGDRDWDNPRPGETVLDAPVRQDAAVQFIGVIHTPFKSRDDCPRQGDPDGPDCVIELEPRFGPALNAVRPGDKLEILYWLHQARRDLLTQTPRSGETRGTFSLRSPVRPNPIGTSIVQLVAVDDLRLTVRGLDCLDGTPLLDIKPDRCGYVVRAPAKR